MIGRVKMMYLCEFVILSFTTDQENKLWQNCGKKYDSTLLIKISITINKKIIKSKYIENFT